MFNKVIKVVLVTVMIAGVAYFGACIYGNFISTGETRGPVLPGADKAAYTVHIENTGNVLFTDRYELVGQVYTLHGYWEMAGDRFKYRSHDLVLDERIFGDITVHRRE
jgi:hypothetical protein